MRCEVFKPTTDDWCGSFKMSGGDLLVRVAFFKYPNGGWAVYASGNDDLAVFKQFEPTEEKSAWCCFLEVIGFDYVNMGDLHKLGFTSD